MIKIGKFIYFIKKKCQYCIILYFFRRVNDLIYYQFNKWRGKAVDNRFWETWVFSVCRTHRLRLTMAVGPSAEIKVDVRIQDARWHRLARGPRRLEGCRAPVPYHRRHRTPRADILWMTSEAGENNF